MRRKILLILLLAGILLIFSGNTIGSKAEEKYSSGLTYQFSFPNAVITGEVGSALSNQDYVINFGGKSLVRKIPAGTDISSWFSGVHSDRPFGVDVTVSETAEVGATGIKIEFTGTPYGASEDEMKMCVPEKYFDILISNDKVWSEVSFTNLKAPQYNIKRNYTVPSGYGGAGNDIYFKCNKGNGFILSGSKGTAIANTELNVFLNANFIRDVSAGTVINSWFTGATYGYNESTHTTRTSYLPDGITAKIKYAVKKGDNSFVIVFSGTPAKGSNDLIAFTIPKDYISHNYQGEAWDTTGPAKVISFSGQYCYNITTTDPTELYSEYIEITYPDVDIPAGYPVKESDGLVIRYELFGYDANGNRIKFNKGNFPTNPTVRGMSYQDAGTNNYNDVITTYTGLTARITKIEDYYFEATLSGTPSKHSSYPYTINGYSFVLNQGYTTVFHRIRGIASDTTTLRIVEPEPELTMSTEATTGEVRITAEVGDPKATVNCYSFIVNLGNDTLAKDLPANQSITVFYDTGSSSPTLSNRWNNISASIHFKGAKKGANKVEITLNSFDKILKSYKGKLYLVLPREYLTIAGEYGYADFYPIKTSIINVDVKSETPPEDIIDDSADSEGENSDSGSSSSSSSSSGEVIITPREYSVEKEDKATPDIWVNGKDDKNQKTFAKTYTLDGKFLVPSIPSGCKAIVSVTDTTVTSYEDAFSNGKGQKSSIAKASYKSGKVVVTAGKTEGTARVWLAAYDSKKKAVKACGYVDIIVGTAPKKVFVVKLEYAFGNSSAGENGVSSSSGAATPIPDISNAVKSISLNAGESVALLAGADGTELSMYSKFFWTVTKDGGCLEVVPSEDKKSAIISVKSAPTTGKPVKAKLVVTSMESGKKANCTILISNEVTGFKGFTDAISIESAKDAAKQKDIKLEPICSANGKTTDKIKVYITDSTGKEEGYTCDGKKFTLTSKSKSIKVSYKNGTVTLKAAKGTENGTTAKLIVVATHADKTVDVFESGVITVG